MLSIQWCEVCLSFKMDHQYTLGDHAGVCLRANAPVINARMH